MNKPALIISLVFINSGDGATYILTHTWNLILRKDSCTLNKLLLIINFESVYLVNVLE